MATLIINRTVTETATYTVPADLARRWDGAEISDLLNAAGWPEESNCEVNGEEVNWTDITFEEDE